MRVAVGVTVLLAARLAIAQVIISEVLADPPGAEAHEEFVELRNTSDTAWVELAGWRLGDDDELDRIVDAGQGTRLPPGAIAVVLDASYFDGSTVYEAVRATGRILTIEDRSFGHAGWSNSRPERVLLVDAGGDTVDVMSYDPAAGRPGHSWERGPGEPVWRLSHLPGGTPGRQNSVTQPPSPAGRLQVSATPDPFDERLEIDCRLPAAPALLAVTLFDAEGRQVRRLRDWTPVGVEAAVSWDGRRTDGRPVPPGLYILWVQASIDGRILTDKSVVVRH